MEERAAGIRKEVKVDTNVSRLVTLQVFSDVSALFSEDIADSNLSSCGG